MRRLVPWLICLAVLWCRTLPAQGTAAPANSADSQGSVEEIEPSVYYVKDKDGRLVPMFGFAFEDFMRAFKQIRGLDREDVPPRFVIEEMTANGKVVGAAAELRVRFSVRLLEKGPLRVPLGLDETIVRRTGGDGSAEPILEHDDRDGYVAWIGGAADKPQEVSLDVTAPLETLGGETILRLHTPRATRSELRLNVPLLDGEAAGQKDGQARLKKIQGRVSEGALLESVAAGDAKSMDFVARGLSGDFELSWRDSDAQTARMPTVLTAVGRILARIDEHSVNTEATLEVSGHGSAFDRFRIRLPQGAELLSSSPPNIKVVEAPQETQKAKKDGQSDGGASYLNLSDARRLEVQLPEKTLGPVTIRLATRQSHGQDNAGQLVELCGFEVDDASQQWGHIALAVADDIHVSWNRQYRVRQVEDLPETLQYEDVVAGFAYSAQPCSLQAWLVPRKTRLSVEPEHVIFVDGDDVRLEATLRYMVRGKKAFLLEVDLADWELDEVGPATTVAIDGLDVDKTNILRIPLLQRSAGKFEIDIKAHRRIAAEIRDLKLRLPSPRAATSSSSTVLIQPADNIELIPDDDANAALTRQQAGGAKHMPGGYQQLPLFYRGDASKAVFIAERSIHPRKVGVDVQSAAVLQRRTCRVTQKFSYRIEYQPLRFLEIDVPDAVASQGEIEFEVDGSQAIPAALAGQSGLNGDSALLPMAIPLPSPGRIGALELVIRYPLYCKELPPRSGILREIPLIMPRDGTLLGNRLTVKAEPPLEIGVHGDAWMPENGSEKPLSRVSQLKLSNPGAAGKAIVAVHCSQSSRQKSTVVENAWICTDLTGPSRQDWAAFRIYSSREDFDISIPRGVAHGDVEIFLDGKPLRPKEASENHLRVAMPGGKSQEHLLEVGYHFPGDRPAAGRLSLELPSVGKDAWNRRLYWELILPQNEHVIVDPPGFVNEYTWGWNGFFWGHKAVLGRDYLADWIGARSDVRDVKRQLPGETSTHGTNRYVFSSLGNPASPQCCTIGRSWIVLWASSAALAVGLVLIYVPIARHPVLLLAAGLGLLAMSLIYPAAAVLLLQAASLGLAAALLAALLQRCLARRRPGGAVLEIGSSLVDKDSTQTQRIAPPPPVDSTPSGENRGANGSNSKT